MGYYQDISATAALKEAIEKSKDDETNIVNRVIFSDTFEIVIPVDKWPDLIKEIDINETVPPTYAAVEIKCYDFYENLRPDLYLIILEVAATSVDGSKEVIVETKFYSKQPEINTRRVHFPYAVLVDRPLKYRTTELSLDGERTIGEWRNTESCSALIDITTPAEKLTCENATFEIEVAETWFDEQNTSLQAKIIYQLNDKLKNKLISFTSDNLLQEISLYKDIDANLYYEIYVLNNTSISHKMEKKLLNDTYLYIIKK